MRAAAVAFPGAQSAEHGFELPPAIVRASEQDAPEPDSLCRRYVGRVIIDKGGCRGDQSRDLACPCGFRSFPNWALVIGLLKPE